MRVDIEFGFTYVRPGLRGHDIVFQEDGQWYAHDPMKYSCIAFPFDNHPPKHSLMDRIRDKFKVYELEEV